MPDEGRTPMADDDGENTVGMIARRAYELSLTDRSSSDGNARRRKPELHEDVAAGSGAARSTRDE